ncbi:acyl-CoA thioesterase [Plastoroseomonas arctica]|uniref:Acyl-CoA thioesterase n=1 Tax=Plastoroseomonas arctica TaxID=1509237 RepID=A0AAF1JU37_9PROT|nr:thioesterase family protein [Plastoroseomonas arctica]MBR0653557.1 acyl-CoA thioesterase [Plastoroseomonas arctica]
MPDTRAAYRRFFAFDTRWHDNDAYGHINNVVYYAFFDTAVARFLTEEGVLEIPTSPAVGLVVETQCRYFAPVSFPDRVTCGLRCARVGTASVQYELAIFRNDEDAACAEGYFVHVYVERADQGRSTPIPARLRAALEGLVTGRGAPLHPTAKPPTLPP